MVKRTFAIAVTLLLLASPESGWAQQERLRVLSFETRAGGSEWTGWQSIPSGAFSLDAEVAHGGLYAGRLVRGPESEGDSSIVSIALPVSLTGDTLVLIGWLKAEGVTGYAGVWLSVAGIRGVIRFDDMQDRGTTGTTDWTEWSISLPLHQRADSIVVGALLVGEGIVWVDDFALLIAGERLEEGIDPSRIRHRRIQTSNSIH